MFWDRESASTNRWKSRVSVSARNSLLPGQHRAEFRPRRLQAFQFPKKCGDSYAIRHIIVQNAQCFSGSLQKPNTGVLRSNREPPDAKTEFDRGSLRPLKRTIHL